jgi:hypothetical protein
MEVKMVVENKPKLVRISSIFGGGFAIIGLGFYLYCYKVASRFPEEATGRIYEFDYHGTLLYLNKFEYYTLIGIPITALLFGIVTAILMKYKVIKL